MAQSQTMDTLLRVEALATAFPVRKGPRAGTVIRAVDDISFTIRHGEILGLVGESGCGKSTLGKTLMGMVAPASGRITFDGMELSGMSPRTRRQMRDRLQYVYQDAGASLDPRWTVGRSIEEPLIIHSKLRRPERQARVLETIAAVGLRPEHLDRYPHELSGGQQRRIGLARILTLHPKLVILDEPTAGLDVSVQATILKLLLHLRETYDLTYLFISHDLGVVRAICNRVAVMYLGRIVELADAATLFQTPRHPYTRSLLSAVPEPGERRVVNGMLLEGDPPDPGNLPSGCRFRNRCRQAGAGCDTDEPGLEAIEPDHAVACRYPLTSDELQQEDVG
ncbi:MAG TPA: ABC transporter ATP-binding protein [Rhodopila sp.]